MLPIRRPDGADRRPARARRRDLGRGRAALRPRRRSTSTTSPRRRASPATAACGSPRSRPPRWPASSGSSATDRWVPASLDLGIALEQSRLDQTYNTPALATLFLLADQIDWMLGHGGLEWAASRCDRSAETLYGWAEASAVATPYVAKPDERSHVVGTIDFADGVDAAADRRGAAGERHRRHRAVPQARTQPAADRDVPGHRARRRRGPHPGDRLRGRRARRLNRRRVRSASRRPAPRRRRPARSTSARTAARVVAAARRSSARVASSDSSART